MIYIVGKVLDQEWTLEELQQLDILVKTSHPELPKGVYYLEEKK